MGEVWKAQDTKLGREVAIKSLPVEFAQEVDRLARFEREAKLLASLNHPNICTVYDVGPNYLVMELIGGLTLADRLQQGAIPLEEVLGIARQVADALEAAHERGITHRDLKPGNIKVKPDGAVKVLDFGLAKAGGAAVLQSDNLPTGSLSHTQAGIILGTVAYMAPEQAKGKDVDQRADIYAFGAVVYEMVTGQRLHQGETTTEVIASVIKEDPDWEKVPQQLQRLLRRCLQKDPAKRLRHIGDVMALVDETPDPAPRVESAPAPKRSLALPIIALVAIVGLGAVVMLWAPWRSEPKLQAVRFEIQPNEKMKFITGGFPSVSPNGRWVVFQAAGTDGVTRQWLRALDSVEERPLPGTESQNGQPPPVFWSYDSRFVAFSLTPGPVSPGQLMKLDITGGPPQKICDIAIPAAGGTWSRDGVIVFSNALGPLMRVPAAGGVATPITALDASRKETGHRFPQFLPDGHHFLYLRTSVPANGASAPPESTAMYLGSIDLKPEEQSLKPVSFTESQAVYSPLPIGGKGRLLFLRDTTLFAQPFDPDHLELSGEAVPISEQVGSFAPATAGLFSVSDNGVLAYRLGASGAISQLTWFNREGRSLGPLGDPGSYNSAAVTSDGGRVAFGLFDPKSGNSNIWVTDSSRGTTTQLTFNRGRADTPVFSPDGKTIIFASNREGRMDLYEKPADGSGEERLLLKSDQDKAPTSWSRDGRFLLFTSNDPKTGYDIWILPLERDAKVDVKPVPFLRTPAAEFTGRFSPDGRWVAYLSNETGSIEVFVRPFSLQAEATSDVKWVVSKGGGAVDAPRWRGDGKELFYTRNSEQWSVEVETEKIFHAGTPSRLFETGFRTTQSAVTADGQRFLFGATKGGAQLPFTVVLNWHAPLTK
jgi:Tol biopolymer transport system component